MSWIILLLVVMLAGCAVASYNGLITARNAFRNAYAQIDVQLQRRHDLIPNLLETAKASLAHQRSTLEAVVQARNTALQAVSAARGHAGEAALMQQLASAEHALGREMGRFLALAESCPDLKASQTMTELIEQLATTENRVAFARQAYNDQVMSYNNRRERFPGNLLAGSFRFVAATLLEIQPSEAHKRAAPTLSFD